MSDDTRFLKCSLADSNGLATLMNVICDDNLVIIPFLCFKFVFLWSEQGAALAAMALYARPFEPASSMCGSQFSCN